MRKIIKPEINKHRIRKGLLKSDDIFGNTGAFYIPREGSAGLSSSAMKVIACEGDKKTRNWDHVSVSLATRMPTWDEMCYIKNLFWDEEEVVIQFHPPKTKYKNKHPYCLHLWKSPQKIELPPEKQV